MPSLSKQKITPNLWYDTKAMEAAEFYVSIFKNSKLGKVSRYGQEGFETHGMAEGTVMTVEFMIEGQYFLALNGGPMFKFSEAVSFVVHCKDQREIDYYWDKLAIGGDEKAQICGWLKDKFGLSWQVVPDRLAEMLGDSDKEKAGRVMTEMLKMKKIELDILEKSYDNTMR